MEEDVEEADKEIDVGEAPLTRESVPEQVPAPLMPLLAAFGIWAGNPGDQVVGGGLVTSSRAQGKLPTVQVE